MGYEDAFSNLGSIMEIMRDLEYVNNFVQVSIDRPNANWKSLGILGNDRKEIIPQPALHWEL